MKIEHSSFEFHGIDLEDPVGLARLAEPMTALAPRHRLISPPLSAWACLKTPKDPP